MTLEERDAAIAQIKADRVMPLPRCFKEIERIMAEYESVKNPDRKPEEAAGRSARERARYEAFDAAPSNV